MTATATSKKQMAGVARPQQAAIPFGMAAFVITLAGFVVYWNTLHNVFALDDFYRIADNPGIHSFWPPWRHFFDPRTMSTLDRITQYRPLLPLTLSINYVLAGDSLVGYHLFNLLLQIAAGVLVYALSLELIRDWSGLHADPRAASLSALACALVFTVHPVSGIAVNYLSARDLLLMQVFLSGSLLAYLYMRRRGPSAVRWAAVLVLFALSLLAKTNGVVMPALVWCFEVVVAGESPRSARPWQRALPFALVVLAFFAFTRFALGFSDMAQVVSEQGSPFWYAVTQLQLHLFHYAFNFVWPFWIRELPYVETPWTPLHVVVLLGAVFVASTLLFARSVRRTERLLAFCILAYWLMMAPESSVLPFHQLAADYRPYPASAFLFLGAMLFLLKRVQTRTALEIFAAAFIYFSGASIYMNTHWSSGERLWTHSVEHGGDPVAHLNLAMSISDRRDPRVRAQLEEALRMNPNFVVGHIDLGLLLIDLGDPGAGLQHVQQAVLLNPGWAQSHYWLASAFRKTGKAQGARVESAAAAKLDPRNAEYSYQAGLDAQAAGDARAVLEYVAQIERVDGNYKETRFMKAFALQSLGRTQEAIGLYEEILGARPDHAQVEIDLGYALIAAGRCGEAVQHLQHVLAQYPANASARAALSKCGV